jgi:hypothetical protein
MCRESFTRAVKKSFHDFLYRFQASLFGAQPGLIVKGLAHFPARHDSLLFEAVHNGQDSGVRARARRGQRAMNLAHRAFAQGPKYAQTFQFERGEVENRMPRAGATRLAGALHMVIHFHA